MSDRSLPRNAGPHWLVASIRRQRVVVCSRIRHWVSHWDVTAGQSRRCGGATCLLCQLGLPKQFRYVCLVVDQSGCQRLVELRERHYGLMEILRNQQRGELGAVLVIRKTGEAKNSPVEITSTGQEQVIEQSIDRLVDSLGLPAKHVQEAEQVIESEVEKLLAVKQSELEAKWANTD